jgi:hypothetical protein
VAVEKKSLNWPRNQVCIIDVYDLDREGTFDVYDLDGEGTFDVYDLDGEGTFDVYDLDGEGTFENSVVYFTSIPIGTNEP